MPPKRRHSVTEYLDDEQAWLLEILALNVFFVLNGDRSDQTESPFVFLARALGPGCRFAFFATNAISFALFLWVRPALVARYSISRGNFAGDLLAESCYFMFVTYSALGLVGRLLPRPENRPRLQSTRVPWIMLGDALPKNDPWPVWFVFGVELSRLAMTVLGMHTILLGCYRLRLANFAWLLVLQTVYVLVAAVDTVSRCGGPFGIPAGGARRVAAARALVLVPFVVMFGVWTVVVSRVYSW